VTIYGAFKVGLLGLSVWLSSISYLS